MFKTNLRGISFLLTAIMLLSAAPLAVFAADGDFVIENGVLTQCNSQAASVIIPPTVTTIGDMAFTQATIVSSITVPSSVKTIEPMAFYGAGFLESISVDSANANYASVNGVLFNKDKTILYQYPTWKDNDSYTVPSGVTTIADWSLNTSEIETLIIPDSVTTIGEFVGSSSYLYSLKLGNNITRIGDNSFGGCAVLQDVSIPQSVTYIGRKVFSGMGTMVDTSDTPLYSTVTATILNSAVQIEEGAFLDSPSLVIYGYSGSTAEKYANENGIAFNALKSGEVLGVAERVDTDEDGLPDDWEINGVTVDGDYLPLQEWGADPNVKDVFVEIDWMEGLRPNYADLLPVYEAYKKHGINLHVDAGADSVDYVRNAKWGDASGSNELAYSLMFNTEGANWTSTVNANVSTARLGVFRHCLFVNRFDLKGASGTADTPGQIFIIARGTIGNEDVPGTFMHELGHSLGLRHGGDQEGGEYNFKPNYLSVMNYTFQFGGLYGTGALDYSNYKLPDLDENNLNENSGVDPEGLTADAGVGTVYYYKGKAYKVPYVAYKKIDFNQNWKPGSTDYENAIKADINTGEGKAAISPVLTGFNDWEYLLSEDWGAFERSVIGNLGAAKSVTSFEVNTPDELSEVEVVELKNALLEATVVSSPEDAMQKTRSTPGITCIYSDMTDLETQQAFLSSVRSDKPALDLALENGDYLFKKYTDGGYDEVKDEAVVSKAKEITKNYKTDYEKLKAVHDWVAENIWYDLDDLNSEDRALDSMTDARGVLETGHSVCDGYSYLSKALLNSLGIPTIRITGNVIGSPIGHAWNASYVDGRWIQFDATWDSQNRWKDGKKVNSTPIKATHDYFDTTDNILDGHRFYWSNGAGLILHDNVVIAGSVGVGETSVTIPSSAVEISERAFDTCPYLEEVSIPSGTKKIGILAFVDCPSLNSVTFANGVETVGDGAFSGCEQLTSIEFPESITSIGDSAFHGTGLENVILPGKITTVERFAFSGCINLESVFIPDNVTAINDAAFGFINPNDGLSYYPTIYGNAGSYAEKYTGEKGLEFVTGTIPKLGENK